MITGRTERRAELTIKQKRLDGCEGVVIALITIWSITELDYRTFPRTIQGPRITPMQEIQYICYPKAL